LDKVTFEWDARKAAANLKKHKVAFEDAATVFRDPLATTFPDPDHLLNEHREIHHWPYNRRAADFRCPFRAGRKDPDH
jgi:uncharacterized DUF497 family protein